MAVELISVGSELHCVTNPTKKNPSNPKPCPTNQHKFNHAESVEALVLPAMEFRRLTLLRLVTLPRVGQS